MPWSHPKVSSATTGPTGRLQWSHTSPQRFDPAIVDQSALAHPTILVSGGRRGLDLELAPADLAELTRAGFAVIGQPVS